MGMRIIGIHAGIEDEAEIVAVRQDAVEEFVAQLAKLLLALWIPEEILSVLADGYVSVHAAAVDTHNRLRHERCGESHVTSDLAADQLVELDLVGSSHDFAVAIIDFKLRRRNFRVVFLILEAHRALHFRRGVDERAERVARQRVIVAARVDVFELACIVKTPLGLGSVEEEALDFISSV
jgi:hypothetical protein